MGKKNKGGRPRIELSNDQKTQVEALAAVLTVEQIADYLGIGRTTFYDIMDRDPVVSERYKRGKSKAIGSVAQGLLQQARNGNTVAAMFYLKTNAGWREKEHGTQHDMPEPTEIKIEVVDAREKAK